MNWKTINQTKLRDLLTNNPTFKLINQPLQEAIERVLGQTEVDLTSVDDTRVGSDFLKYLFKKHQFPTTNHYDDLLVFLVLLAGLNQRRNITQADLVFLGEVNLPFPNWSALVLETLRKTMFRDLYRQMDENGDYKDELTIKFENHQVSTEDQQKAGQIVEWSQEQVAALQTSRAHVQTNPQLINQLDQALVSSYYDQAIDLITRRLKFQILGFEVVLKNS